jgi:hypothetical protein
MFLVKEIIMENIANILSDAIFTDLSKMVSNKNEPYAISLVCNDEMSNFFLALSDLENLDKLISKNSITNNDDYLYYKWSPNEWENLSYNLENSELKEFNKKLSHYEDIDKNDFNKYRKAMFDICISSLINVKSKMETIEINKNTPVFISFTDISKLEEIQNYSAYRINSQTVYEMFKDRFIELDWGKNLGQYNPFE